MPTAPFPASFTAIPIACCSSPREPARSTAATAPARASSGRMTATYEFSTGQWERAIDYIARTPVIRDVLLSGGDPLVLSDDRLEWLLSRLRKIPHVEFLRIGSKVPVVLPQRVTPALTKMLKKLPPVVDEPALHSSVGADARKWSSRARVWPTPVFRSGRRRRCWPASTTTWTCAAGCFTACFASASSRTTSIRPISSSARRISAPP